ncbi:hypothetical protein [Kistimonas asteriae]|uniref:hypothetical protein n=1 Tax=Kistimonas asteriae TaxID=517724 RepID=UPI001BA95C9E|nr:hypothetical protein [Kistimonas asteriae]
MQAVSSTGTPSTIPTIQLPQGAALHLMRGISHTDKRDSTSYFQQQMPFLTHQDCFFLRQALYEYAISIKILTEKLLPILDEAPPQQEDIQPVHTEAPPQQEAPQPIQTEPGATTLPTIPHTQTITVPTIPLTHDTNTQLMHSIVNYSSTNSSGTNAATKVIRDFFPFFQSEDQSKLVVSLRRYTRTLYQDALQAIARLEGPRCWFPNKDIQARTVFLVRPETLPPASSPADTSSHISVTTEANQTSATQASSKLSTATTQDLILLPPGPAREHLSTALVIPPTTQYLPTPQQHTAIPELPQLANQPGPSSAYTSTPIERPRSVQSTSTSSSKSNPKQRCSDGIERPLISKKRGLEVRSSPVHADAKGVFLYKRTCDPRELIADYEGTFVYRYQLRSRSGHYLMSTSVSLKKENEFLHDERYVSWSEVYFATGNNFLEIGIIGRKEIAFINHDEENANAELITNFDDTITYKRRIGNDSLLCVSRKDLGQFLDSLLVQVIATKKINDKQEILCNYKTKQKEVDFKNYIVLPTEKDKEEFTHALEASAKDAPKSDSEPNPSSESDDSSSENDGAVPREKFFPQKKHAPKKRSKRKPPQPINVADTAQAYGDFDTDILKPLRNQFQNQEYGHLCDIIKEIEKEGNITKKECHTKILTLIAKQITLPETDNEKEKEQLIKESKEMGIKEEDVNTLLNSAEKIINHCFDISDQEWQLYINERKTLKHTERPRKRIKISSSTVVQH